MFNYLFYYNPKVGDIMTTEVESIADDICEVYSVDKERVKRARENMKSDPTIYDISETFKALSDPTRIRIIFALSQEEMCVCDIACLLGLTESAISHQLRILRNLRLVKYHKEGRMAYYSLDDHHINNLLDQVIEHTEER